MPERLSVRAEGEMNWPIDRNPGPPLNPPEVDPMTRCTHCEQVYDASEVPMTRRTECCSTCIWCPECVDAEGDGE